MQGRGRVDSDLECSPRILDVNEPRFPHLESGSHDALHSAPPDGPGDADPSPTLNLASLLAAFTLGDGSTYTYSRARVPACRAQCLSTRAPSNSARLPQIWPRARLENVALQTKG